MISLSQLVALAIFGSYFSLILILFGVIAHTIRWRDAETSSQKRRVGVYASLALASFLHTWYYMVKFLLWSRDEYESRVPDNRTLPALERLANWLLNTELFEQAWFTVCKHPQSWLISEQLCLFTVGAWTLFLYVESKRHSVLVLRPWAFMLLGQLVAISVASNLFCLALVVAPAAREPRTGAATRTHRVEALRVPPFVLACIAAALGAVANTPSMLETRFLSNLLLMHGAIVLPLLPNSSNFVGTGGPRFDLAAPTCYVILALASLAIRVKTLSGAGDSGFPPLLGLPAQLERLHSHPAQASIGWDVIWTTLSFAVYEMVERNSWPPRSLLWSLGGTIGSAAPVILAFTDDDQEDAMQS
ncbi:hypothetical protein BKA62DRAFT_70206 [Auriculariales sp. MPI-PUGE-AT-0066]|nr:hypothetical protein BKA62DRAFT_70206 [Auriculariales sp. MPI-PUGE-AT-0066]